MSFLSAALTHSSRNTAGGNWSKLDLFFFQLSRCIAQSVLRRCFWRKVQAITEGSISLPLTDSLSPCSDQVDLLLVDAI